VRQLAAALVLILVAALAGCHEGPPQGPTADDYRAERARLKAKVAKAEKRKKQAPVAVAPQAQPGESALDGSYAGVDADYIYDAKGKRDPFETYRHSAGSASASMATPLMNYELEQLSVVAAVWDTTKPRALVADPRGMTYVVREGTPMGKNAGQVIHIGDNLVLVKETYVDFAGEVTTKDVELRIRRSQGG
jgi:Tfp pilus assembly protein PilP